VDDDLAAGKTDSAGLKRLGLKTLAETPDSSLPPANSMFLAGDVKHAVDAVLSSVQPEGAETAQPGQTSSSTQAVPSDAVSGLATNRSSDQAAATSSPASDHSGKAGVDNSQTEAIAAQISALVFSSFAAAAFGRH
jgi:hypothetical protein